MTVGGDDGYKVDLEQLDDAITSMEKFGIEVEGWLADVDRGIAELHLAWNSAAASAQREAHDRWMAAAAEMRANLEELREVARRAHTNYQGAMTTNQRMWPA